MSNERIIYLDGKAVTEAQIPEVFNLGNLFAEYRETLKKLDEKEADQIFAILIRKQLAAFIQETVEQPLTTRVLYQLKKEADGGVTVNDHDYPQNPNIVKRANPRIWYKLAEDADIQQLYKASPFAQIFLDRYLLEYEQIKLLVDNYLANDPVLSLPYLQHLSESTQPMSIQLDKGKTIEGFVSNWYAMAMPSTKVHAGKSSYFNMYRIVAVPSGDSFEYFVQKQGLLHKIKQKTQVKELLNLDQVKKTFPQTERDIMLKIIQLHSSRNRTDPQEVITEIGTQYARGLLRKINKAKVRQQNQINAIEGSIKAILSIFKDELKNPSTPDQLERLKIFFEGIGNPLYFNKNVPEDVLVKKYREILAHGKGRELFIASLVPSIPSILWRASGTVICGSFSMGGLAGNSINGFGGLKDTCMTCPGCGRLSTNPNICDFCNFTRAGYSSPHRSSSHSHTHKPKVASTLGPHHKELPPAPLLQLTPKRTVGANYVLNSLFQRQAA